MPGFESVSWGGVMAPGATPAAVVNKIFAETGGNPFFVEELFRHLEEEDRLYDSSGQFRAELEVGELDAPPTVRLVVARRLARLGDLTQKVLATAAKSKDLARIETDQCPGSISLNTTATSACWVVRTMSTMLSTSSGRALAHSWCPTTAYTRPRPPAASGMSCADDSTRDNIGSHANGWVSSKVRLIDALSTPSSSSRAAKRCARALAHRNEPVSVVSPA